MMINFILINMFRSRDSIFVYEEDTLFAIRNKRMIKVDAPMKFLNICSNGTEIFGHGEDGKMWRLRGKKISRTNIKVDQIATVYGLPGVFVMRDGDVKYRVYNSRGYISTKQEWKDVLHMFPCVNSFSKVLLEFQKTNIIIDDQAYSYEFWKDTWEELGYKTIMFFKGFSYRNFIHYNDDKILKYEDEKLLHQCVKPFKEQYWESVGEWYETTEKNYIARFKNCDLELEKENVEWIVFIKHEESCYVKFKDGGYIRFYETVLQTVGSDKLETQDIADALKDYKKYIDSLKK